MHGVVRIAVELFWIAVELFWFLFFYYGQRRISRVLVAGFGRVFSRGLTVCSGQDSYACSRRIIFGVALADEDPFCVSVFRSPELDGTVQQQLSAPADRTLCPPVFSRQKND